MLFLGASQVDENELSLQRRFKLPGCLKGRWTPKPKCPGLFSKINCAQIAAVIPTWESRGMSWASGGFGLIFANRFTIKKLESKTVPTNSWDILFPGPLSIPVYDSGILHDFALLGYLILRVTVLIYL